MKRAAPLETVVVVAIAIAALVASACHGEPCLGDEYMVYFCDPEDAEFLSAIPLDDSGKFHLILFTGPGCGPCEQLKRDFERDAALGTLRRWAHWHVYDWSDLRQRHRFEAYKVRTFPTLVLVPPRDSAVYPYTYVERMSGYDGDPGRLFRRLIDKLRAFFARFRPRPRPSPDTPGPSPEVEPRPDTVPTPPLVIPDLPIDLTPEEAEPAEPAEPPAPEYPQYLEAVIVVDPEGVGEKIKVALAERLIDRYAERAGGDLKTRIVEYAEAEGLYPVAREDTPAVCLTKGGRLIGYVSIGVLQALRAEEAAPGGPVPTLPKPETEAAGLERLKSGLLQELGDRLAASERANSEERRGVLALLGKLHERLAGGSVPAEQGEADRTAEQGEVDRVPGGIPEVGEAAGTAAKLWLAGGGGLGVALLIAGGLWLGRRLYRRADESGRLDQAKDWMSERPLAQVLQGGLEKVKAIREAGERARRETADVARQAADRAKKDQEAAESVAKALEENAT